jgi:glycosyltransferase involved in cell wall biosynthesis
LRSEWSGDFEGPSSSLLGSGTAKTLPAQELGMPVSASSSVLISDISGKKKSGSLDSGRWPLDSAPKALPGWAQGLVDLYPDFSGKGLVVFAGFRQLEELPEIYHGAGAFIHPALEEPWGLVINEAMASGLPILSSRNVGAAEELVSEADNGFLFDPKDAYQIARYMGLISRLPLEERLAMGEKSREIVEAKAPKRAFGLGLKKLLAVENFE